MQRLTPINRHWRQWLAPLIFLAGCDSEPTPKEKAEANPAIVSVTVKASGPIEHVQQLTLRMYPSRLYQALAIDDGDGLAKYVEVLTDSEGKNRVMRSSEERPASCAEWDHSNEPVILSEHIDAEGNRIVVYGPPPPFDINKVPPLECAWVPHSDLTLIDTLAADPLPTLMLARDFSIASHSFGEYVEILASAGGWIGHRRDTFIILSDGRECEARVLFNNSTIPYHLTFPLDPHPAFNGASDVWRIDLTIDVSNIRIDPSQCATGYELNLVPGSAIVSRM